MTSYDRDLGRCLSAWLLAAASIAWGHDTGPEFIESFDTRLEISDAGALAVYHIIDVHPTKTGALAVRHRIDVHPHGDEIRRGLFFELPEQVGPLHGFAAALNGEALAPEVDDGTIILAAEAPLQTHKTQRFELSYRAASPWWRTADGVARLRWAPVIAQFELAWREARILRRWSGLVAALFRAAGRATRRRSRGDRVRHPGGAAAATGGPVPRR